ncbi:MAG: hypothetical protein ACRCU3_08975 [Eubacteriaceae bacterium]
MAITQEFRNAVAGGDLRTVRIMLKDSLVVDPTFLEYNQMIDLSSNLTGLFDVHDGEKLNDDISYWSKDYMDEQMVQVVYNFSKERVELLKNICKHLYGARVEKIENDRKTKGTPNRTITKTQIGTGVCFAGVVVVVTGIALSEALVIGAGVGLVVIGGVMIFMDNR